MRQLGQKSISNWKVLWDWFLASHKIIALVKVEEILYSLPKDYRAICLRHAQNSLLRLQIPDVIADIAWERLNKWVIDYEDEFGFDSCPFGFYDLCHGLTCCRCFEGKSYV